MKLYYSPQSPYARKARIAAIELGLADALTVETATVVPGAPNHDYARAANPLRKVPALVLSDGMALYDSAVICDYLDAEAGGGRLVPAGGAERFRVLRDHALAQGMTDALILVRYETWARPEEYRWPDWIDDQWDRVWTGLATFEGADEALPAPEAAASAPLDLAQIALGCVLGYIDLRWPDAGWRERAPGLAARFEALAQRPSFAETAPP